MRLSDGESPDGDARKSLGRALRSWARMEGFLGCALGPSFAGSFRQHRVCLACWFSSLHGQQPCNSIYNTRTAASRVNRNGRWHQFEVACHHYKCCSLTRAAGCCRHLSVSRRLFRQAVAVAGAHREGLVAAGGVKTLLVWAHQEKKMGHLARVSSPCHGRSLICKTGRWLSLRPDCLICILINTPDVLSTLK